MPRHTSPRRGSSGTAAAATTAATAATSAAAVLPLRKERTSTIRRIFKYGSRPPLSTRRSRSSSFAIFCSLRSAISSCTLRTVYALADAETPEASALDEGTAAALSEPVYDLGPWIENMYASANAYTVRSVQDEIADRKLQKIAKDDDLDLRVDSGGLEPYLKIRLIVDVLSFRSGSTAAADVAAVAPIN